jgi:metallo-beta-lactamase family protein
MLKLSFYGAAGTVTGSCHLLDTGNTRVLLDCGMFQGSKSLKERNYIDFPFNPAEIDFLILSHAHIDHSGLIPKLIKKGFKGEIITSGATFDLCSIMLPDSGHIQEMEVERKNRKLTRAGLPLIEPIYTTQDAYKSLSFFRAIDYGLKINLSDDVTLRLQDAGHIMGSSIVELWISTDYGEIKLVYTGDLGNTSQPIINDPYIVKRADYLIMESTYGNRLHQDKGNKNELLKKVITETFSKGGNLIIPAFAVERTQDILYDLSLLQDEGILDGIDIVVDSPLAISATEIFCRNVQYFDAETTEKFHENGQCPIILPDLRFTRTAEESKSLNENYGNKIIISASGMCDAGRIKHHLKHNLWRPQSTVLFVGYQAEGTLGRMLLEGAKKVKIHGEQITVNARIENIDGFSGHADQTGLMKWVQNIETKPKKIFIVHGEEKSSSDFANLIKKATGLEAVIPQYLESYELTPDWAKTQGIDRRTADFIQDREIEAAAAELIRRLNYMVYRDLRLGTYKELLNKIQEISGFLSKYED